MDLAISLLALATALRTPLPRNFDLSPSRSSSASCSPVEAPEGTAARPRAPFSRITSASTVGFPRESRISRPITRAIFGATFGALVHPGETLDMEKPPPSGKLGPDHRAPAAFLA